MEVKEAAPMPVISLQILPSVNFAQQQNHVPIIRELILTNTTALEWQDIVLEITSEFSSTLPWRQSLLQLPAGASHAFHPFPLQVSAQFLATLTEATTESLRMTLSVRGEIIHTQYSPLTVLAFDRWGGVGLLPEMLAAFITPNHPQIPGIIRAASSILQRWTGDPSFDDYQSRNPDRVRKQMAAIYEAIAGLQLVYCSVPASFEESGQRVRLADTIFGHRLANCLDISLLYAACLEAVGIHSLLVIVKGHAFAGGWLVDESFADTVNDDPSLITKRSAPGIGEIAVVEGTCMNAGNTQSFDEASRIADQRLLRTDDFVLFIDVRRARISRVRPLPLRVQTSSGWEVQEEHVATRPSILPEKIISGPKPEYASAIPVTKQRLWERKLLDLTLRNSLLNIRTNRSMIQFATFDVSKLEDALADGEEFQILQKPSDWDHPLRDSGLYQVLHQSDPVADLVEHELGERRIRTYLSESDLTNSLTNLFRSSRLSLEENGANTLFIGLGLLRWYETDASERPRFAPILLIPVEIIRKSAQKGFIIRSREEETILNITLLEMLRQDFGIVLGGLETLPRDESGVDVKEVFRVIRRIVMGKPRWDVEEQAVLGIFSFSKFILWNDIHHNAADLNRHPLVASLVSGKLEWTPGEQEGVEAISDNLLHPTSVALPISTDSSQLQAILSSASGKSFVLHGPPGTGKSQTITNIIAHALYAGKRVLFVAAKKAALDVVESRLNAIGIGPFCLELHSNKAKKSAVLEQLKQTVEITKSAAPENFAFEAERLFGIRSELNGYAEALHERQAFGYSLFDVFTAYGLLPSGEDKVSFEENVLERLDAAQLATWQDLAEQLQQVGSLIGHPLDHPFRGVRLERYYPQLKQEVQRLIEDVLRFAAQCSEQSSSVLSMLKMEGTTITPEQQRRLEELGAQLLQAGDIPSTMLQAEALERTMTQVLDLTNHGKERDRLRTQLLQRFRAEVLKLPAEQLLGEWQLASREWFYPRWKKQKELLKRIRSTDKTGAVRKEQVPGVLQHVIDFQVEQTVLDKAAFLPATAGFLWQNGDCDWDGLARIATALISCNRLAGNLLTNEQLKTWRSRLAAEFSEGSRGYMIACEGELRKYSKLQNQLSESTRALETSMGLPPETLRQHDGLKQLISGWLENLDKLKDWHNYMLVREAVLSAGLSQLLASYEDGNIASEEVALQFRRGFLRSAADYIINKHQVLATFNGGLFEEKVRKFRAISKQFETLTRQELYARLSAGIPSLQQEASQSSEIGMLQRALRTNGRAMSIRRIFDQMPHLLHRLKPCMLMSPISVAQYFDAASPKFDLVIFDEASQMPTSEAVGAIARGRAVIVVGDPKQMPPTNFFSGSAIDEDNIEKEDLESILDDCLALSMPSRHLLWHYRSKHESLIAFSNAKYYENRLLTFPSTDDIVSKVRLVPVEGFYDKGRTRQNRFEAKAIVADVVARLSDPRLDGRSIGIVTFSSAQQTLIEDMLTDVFKDRPEIEKLALEREEPLFVKNLENVQGDERDVILFSIGYGPDQEGKVSLNFGPINREGGWRRLNVAVSRARYEMVVFSTLKSDQINLNRTGSEGVAGLKAFLAYAEKGIAALPITQSNPSGKESGAFENLIADAIRKMGYEVHTQIGTSAFKIDLGVVDPERPKTYLLGLLTDGYNYYQAHTSRDREITQLDVLKMLGWNIHKIWATEWWDSPGKVLAGIEEALKKAEQMRQSDPEPPVLSSEPIVVLPQSPQSFSEVKSSGQPYIAIELPSVYDASPDEFLWPQHRNRIKQQLNEVISAEAPISDALLRKRVLNAWGIARQGIRISAHFDLLISEIDPAHTRHDGRTFFWSQPHGATNYTAFRYASSDELRREAEDLPPEEVANAISEILRQQISLDRMDLVREVARQFGFSRVGTNLVQAVTLGIRHGSRTGILSQEEDRIVGKI
ncbi:MAG: DUF3320 domain-containing protein [Siphonobacter aquaeclarae]|nr:DUF3320 domain-containing protein [Siphonobacter aquaeclarae]